MEYELILLTIVFIKKNKNRGLIEGALILNHQFWFRLLGTN